MASSPWREKPVWVPIADKRNPKDPSVSPSMSSLKTRNLKATTFLYPAHTVDT